MQSGCLPTAVMLPRCPLNDAQQATSWSPRQLPCRMQRLYQGVDERPLAVMTVLFSLAVPFSCRVGTNHSMTAAMLIKAQTPLHAARLFQQIAASCSFVVANASCVSSKGP